jgi:hypothetical protein
MFWTLLLIWIAGGLATVGGLKGVALVQETDDISTEIYLLKFAQSWYAFGMLVAIMLSEIGNQIAKK